VPYKDPEKAHAYHAAYRAANAEKQRVYQAAYRAMHKEKAYEYNIAWRKENKDTWNEYSAKNYAKNHEKISELSAARYAANPQKVLERNAAWSRNNPGARRAISAKHRALKKAQRCTCCTDAEIKAIHDIAALCGREAHVDHIIPLALGGLDCAKNLQALTAEDHIRKTSKLDAGRIAAARRQRKEH
jgi:5-methylcytosine-specific restriction endonuclease McrA